MLWNYFKTTWRTIKQHPFYSGINLLGLTIGLTVGFLILLWVQHEFRYNRFEGAVKNVYKINSNIESNGIKEVWYTSPAAIGAYARAEVPEIEQIARVRGNWMYSVYSSGDQVFEAESAVYTDPELFALFQADFIQGSPAQPFKDTRSVVLTRSMAEKFFGDKPALGLPIQGDFKDRYFVSAVVEDFPENSSLDHDMFFPMDIVAGWYDPSDEDAYWTSMDTDWGNFNYITYLKLAPGADISVVRQQLSQINARNDRNAADNHVERAYELQPIDQMNLYRPDGTPTGMERIRIFIVVAFLTLLIASINYVNLSTARSTSRIKEVSMRKIAGAGRLQLFFQFIWESVFFIALALVFSLTLVWVLLPYFNDLIQSSLQFNLSDPALWKLMAGVGGFILVFSALYPALFLSSFKPMQALKGKITPGMSRQGFRPVLVTVQFVFSAALIIGTLVIGKQLNYLIERSPGYSREQVLMFTARDKMREHMQTVKTELTRIPGVEAVSLSSQTIYQLGQTTGDLDWEGRAPDKQIVIKPLYIDSDFIPMMEMELVSGTNFTGSGMDSTHCILNEAAVKAMGLEDPVGKRFALWDTEGTVLGVIKDFNHQSLKYGIEPVILLYTPDAPVAYLKVAPGKISQVRMACAQLWKHYNGRFPFHYTFLEAGYKAQYASEQTTARLFNIFSVLAVIIACLGLFGLATFSSKARIKEIGIRKVVGASVPRIALMLSLDFLRWVALALLLAFPLAYYVMKNWLDNFHYRISMEWSVFAMSALLVLLIAMFTVMAQSIRAAMANPVDSLRDE